MERDSEKLEYPGDSNARDLLLRRREPCITCRQSCSIFNDLENPLPISTKAVADGDRLCDKSKQHFPGYPSGWSRGRFLYVPSAGLQTGGPARTRSAHQQGPKAPNPS